MLKIKSHYGSYENTISDPLGEDEGTPTNLRLRRSFSSRSPGENTLRSPCSRTGHMICNVNLYN